MHTNNSTINLADSAISNKQRSSGLLRGFLTSNGQPAIVVSIVVGNRAFISPSTKKQSQSSAYIYFVSV
ncbi:hypothetical protein D1814_00255 [Alteromonas sp. BL110]|uniref:hypothetical protein n=1 Tax=Alteromonas sp. BL110 TaxID=1714845 RepID=UPI000E53F502|nr:hypothetical protein [Alteromonas sp. BL110]AXT37231.1 hypothetical protein D1814_00255 [Alteromonas sp. BL110]RKM79969.1 hypothetical protein D7031_13605 [Alteromonas sp. BL110]